MNHRVHHDLKVRIDWSLTTPSGTFSLGPNEMTTAGIANVLDVLAGTGTGGTKLDATHAYVGVGDNNTAFSAGQTDLQAPTNKLRKAMNVGFPSRTGAVLTYQADFTNSEAVFAWNEFGLFWGPSGSTMLSRRVQSLGTKGSGVTWTMTATLSLA